jgi:phage terminase large subunit GpA-like protein
MEYFEGLTAEVRVVKPNGDVVYEQRKERNEPLDLAVMNRAAAAIVGIDRFSEASWQKLEKALGQPVVVSETAEAPLPAQIVSSPGTAGRHSLRAPLSPPRRAREAGFSRPFALPRPQFSDWRSTESMTRYFTGTGRTGLRAHDREEPV